MSANLVVDSELLTSITDEKVINNFIEKFETQNNLLKIVPEFFIIINSFTYKVNKIEKNLIFDVSTKSWDIQYNIHAQSS